MAIRAEMFHDPGRSLPFVGRKKEFEILHREIHHGSRKRWLIVGERGIGKTRLMQEVGLSFGDRCRFFSLRGAGGPGEEPFWLAPEFQRLERAASVVILDDVDSNHAADLGAAGDLLDRVLDGPLLMTAASGRVAGDWLRLGGYRGEVSTLVLPGLSPEDRDRLLDAAGAAASPEMVAAALGNPRAMENPRLLLQYVDALRLERSGSTLATILGPDGLPLQADDALKKVELSVSEISDSLIAELASKPELMRELSPRRFEELVAELYARSGFEVELTRASKDGGVDIYAVQRAPFGSFLTIVDCKRNRADRPIQVGLIRGLYGTVMATDASVGVIATTSYFTQGARTFQEERRHRLGLQDFASLTEMLRSGSSRVSEGVA